MAAPHPIPTARTSAAAVGRLALGALPLLGVALLRLAAPIGLNGDPAPGWIASVALGAVAVVLILAAAALLAAAVHRTGAATAVRATVVGSIAIGLAIGAMTASRASESLPGPALAVAAAAAGPLAALWVLLSDEHDHGNRVHLLVASFVILEVVLACALFLAEAAVSAAPLLFATGAVAVLASVVTPGAGRPNERLPFRGAFLLAGSLGALALARPESADSVVGLAGLLGLGLITGWDAAVLLSAAEVVEPHHPEAAPSIALLASPSTDPVEPEGDRAADETARLARELRGAIEELLQARRIIELQRNEIARAATVEALTGTATRPAILERLALEVAEARRYSHPIAVLLLDIDGFRGVNGAHGLAVSDAILRETSLRMRLRMRVADALGRVGADSFLAILPHTDERGASVFARVLLDRLTGRPVATDAGEIAVTASIGVALMRPGTEVTDEELLIAADEALASARAAGGNRIAFDRLHGLARLDDRRA